MIKQKTICTAQWSELLAELLYLVASSLGLIDLLSFRGVCRWWKYAASTASAQPEAKPWFLVYGENSSKCQLLTEGDKKYYMSLPELVGATCIASSQGWLLVFQESSGSVFLFCPFSRVKIDLPKFEASRLSNHLAAFSSPPTSQNRMVCVISRAKNDKWVLHLLSPGAKRWTEHMYFSDTHNIHAIKGAAYHKKDRDFYFYDPKHKKVLVFSTDKLKAQCYEIVRRGLGAWTLRFGYHTEKYFKKENLKTRLELADDVSISICGIQIKVGGKITCGESIAAVNVADQSNIHKLKGVWIHPRFHQVSSINQSLPNQCV